MPLCVTDTPTLLCLILLGLNVGVSEPQKQEMCRAVRLRAMPRARLGVPVPQEGGGLSVGTATV